MEFAFFPSVKIAFFLRQFHRNLIYSNSKNNSEKVIDKTTFFGFDDRGVKPELLRVIFSVLSYISKTRRSQNFQNCIREKYINEFNKSILKVAQKDKNVDFKKYDKDSLRKITIKNIELEKEKKEKSIRKLSFTFIITLCQT